jgi:hypothetical protein
MKARWLASGIVVGLLLALTLGFAYRGSATMMGGVGRHAEVLQAMEAMHDSPAMEAMHDQMPDKLQQQCDALHDRMIASGSGMMGSGSGMMSQGLGGIVPGSGSGMMGSAGSGMMGG